MEFFDAFDPLRTTVAVFIVTCLVLWHLNGIWRCLGRIAQAMEERNRKL